MVKCMKFGKIKTCRSKAWAGKGFTLIELLVVISIIGILSTLAVVSLNTSRAKARDARRVSDLKAVSTALEVYRDEHDDHIVDLASNWSETINNINVGTNIYLPAGSPEDPDPLRKAGQTDVAKSYVYCSDIGTKFYLLYASLETTPPGKGLNGNIISYGNGDCVNAGGVINASAITCDGGVNFCLGRL